MKRTLRIAVPLAAVLAATYGIATQAGTIARYSATWTADWREWRREKVILTTQLNPSGKLVVTLDGKPHGEPVSLDDYDAGYRLLETIEAHLRNRDARIVHAEVRLPASTPMEHAHTVLSLMILQMDPTDLVVLGAGGTPIARTQYAYGGCEHCAAEGRLQVSMEPQGESTRFDLYAGQGWSNPHSDHAESDVDGLAQILADLAKRGRERREITAPEGLCLTLFCQPEMPWSALVTLLPKLKTPDVHVIYLALEDSPDEEWPEQLPRERANTRQPRYTRVRQMPGPILPGHTPPQHAR